MADPTPVIVFGAFDRHNFGDLLFAHIAAELLRPRPVVFAGLAERDLTAWGGHRVRAIANLAREWGKAQADVVHAGGEILTCSLYEAAIMVQSTTEANRAISRFDVDPIAQAAWAEAVLGLHQHLGYLVAKSLFRNPGRFIHVAIGGTNLEHLPDPMRTEVCARLRESDHVSVRDRVTQSFLAHQDIRTDLVPDPAVLTAELFGARIETHRRQGEPLAVYERFPRGYLAVQFSADFGDDATLSELARQLEEMAATTGDAVVLFRAGAAPWHDDLDVYRRLAGFMPGTPCWIFESLHLWDICALLAGASAYCGSSLHGRIVAEAFGVPGVSLLRTPDCKQTAYVRTWNPDGPASLTHPEQLAEALTRTLSIPSAPGTSDQASLFREKLPAWLELLPPYRG